MDDLPLALVLGGHLVELLVLDAAEVGYGEVVAGDLRAKVLALAGCELAERLVAIAVALTAVVVRVMAVVGVVVPVAVVARDRRGESREDRESERSEEPLHCKECECWECWCLGVLGACWRPYMVD